jgi:hypothetical protein
MSDIDLPEAIVELSTGRIRGRRMPTDRRKSGPGAIWEHTVGRAHSTVYDLPAIQITPAASLAGLFVAESGPGAI